MTTRNPILTLCLLTGILTAPTNIAVAAEKTFYSLDDPNEEGGTFVRSINNHGEVMGTFIDTHHGANYFRFIYGFYKTFTFPDANQSVANRAAWNIHEQIAGTYRVNDGRSHGFIVSGQHPVVVNFPNAVDTLATSINDKGQVAGVYIDIHKNRHAFTLISGKYANIDPKNMGSVQVRNVFINNLGHIAASYESKRARQTYLSVHGVAIALGAPPAQTNFVAAGLNDQDEIVGHCLNGPMNGPAPCFLWKHGVFTPIKLPGVHGPIFAQGINNQRQIAGFYIDEHGKAHGFLAAL